MYAVEGTEHPEIWGSKCRFHLFPGREMNTGLATDQSLRVLHSIVLMMSQLDE